MKELLIANLKMNKTYSETKEYVTTLEKELKKLKDDIKVVLCLPYTSLSLAKQYNSDKFQFGAQNMHEEESGQFTGEISAKMLAELNVKYILIGHSERRKYFNETNEKINKKIKTALRYGFQIILCVGETRSQRNTGKTYLTLDKQINEALNGIYENELKNIVIAYEPVWAIGTGKVAENTDITKAVEEIRKVLAHNYSEEASNKIQVVYGGSLSSQNSNKIFKNEQIVGALIGGASLDPVEFAKIIIK
jgi:triosephosphate isomerase